MRSIPDYIVEMGEGKENIQLHNELAVKATLVVTCAIRLKHNHT